MSAALVLTSPGTLSIERAREIIAACKDVDEAHGIQSQAEAIAVYLRAVGASLDAQNDAAEIHARAKRRVGQLLAQTSLSKGGRPSKTSNDDAPVLTLAELGITKKDSAAAQKLAALPEAEFEQRIAVVRDASEKITQAAILGKGVKQQSSSEQTMRTPRWFFDELSRLFGPFDLDAFADEINHLCDAFYTKKQDALAQPWAANTFANPEFEDMAPIFEWALSEATYGKTSTILAPVGCSQRWYHELAIKGTIYVPDCRINFDNPDGTPTDKADRDTIVVCIGGKHTNRARHGGVFMVRALPVKHLSPKKGAA
jgi:phage N-6-adenine-methyltransferase